MILWRILTMIIPENKGAYNHKSHSENLSLTLLGKCTEKSMENMQTDVRVSTAGLEMCKFVNKESPFLL